MMQEQLVHSCTNFSYVRRLFWIRTSMLKCQRPTMTQTNQGSSGPVAHTVAFCQCGPSELYPASTCFLPVNGTIIKTKNKCCIIWSLKLVFEDIIHHECVYWGHTSKVPLYFRIMTLLFATRGVTPYRPLEKMQVTDIFRIQVCYQTNNSFYWHKDNIGGEQWTWPACFIDMNSTCALIDTQELNDSSVWTDSSGHGYSKSF